MIQWIEAYDKKVLIFTHFSGTHRLFRQLLTKVFGEDHCAFFCEGMSPDELELNTYRFQNEPGYRIMLSDETGGEGRNFQKADELMEKYGPHDAGDMMPDQLSGGMRQRCSLIRTLASDPGFLLLDEAFSALDYQTRVSVSVDIHSIIRNEKKTVLLVTHDISESLMLSDRVIVMTHRPGTVKKIHDLSALKDIAPMQRLEHEAYGAMLKEIWKELDIHG